MMLGKLIWRIGVTIIVGLAVIAADGLYYTTSAEEEKGESNIFRLEELVVTGSRRGIPLEDETANISVITLEQLENTYAKTIDDVLRNAVGVDVEGGLVNSMGYRFLRLRGTPNAGHTLVLADGIPINMPIHGYVDWDAISSDDLARIEIVRGPASSLYGSHAMGGVVNLITQLPEEPFEGKIAASYGTNETVTTSMRLGGRNEKFGFILNGDFATTDGYYAYKERPPREFEVKHSYENWNGDGKFFWLPDDVSSIKLGYTHTDKELSRGRKYRLYESYSDRMFVSYSREVNTDGFEEFADLGWQISAYYQRWDQDVQFDNTRNFQFAYLESIEAPHYGGTVQTSIPFGNRNVLTFGAEYKHREFDKDDNYAADRVGKSGGRQRYVALYAQDEFSLFDEKLNLTLSGRMDWWESFDGFASDSNPSPSDPFDTKYEDRSDNSFSPKVGLSFKLAEKTVLRSSVGRGFQAPDVFDLYTVMQRGTRLIEPNPNLKPEKLVSYEIGVDQYFADTFLFRLTLYRSQGEDFIASRTIIPNSLLQRDNLTEAKMQGIEMETLWDISSAWSVSLGYTYNESTVEDDDEDQDIIDNDLTNSPRNKFKFGLTYANPALFIANFLIKYQDKCYSDLENTDVLDSYWTVNFKITKELFEGMEMSLACENLFDEIYSLPGFQNDLNSPGTIWTLSCAYKF